jgi:elongation factor Ts
MAVSMAEIQKLRKMTGAGMMDCKNALADANGDLDQAMKIIREKGKAVAAKRSDREASEGCVLVKVENGFGAMIALKCETDFVANNADFVALTQQILDAAIANKCKTLEEVKELTLGETTIAQAVVDRSGITGEKMELDGYLTVEAPVVAAYNHQNKNFLCTLVGLNKEFDGNAGHEVAMQVAAMNPISVDKDSVPADILEKEKEVAADKARQEGKPENLIERIAMGRISKFYKEVCLMEQEYIQDGKMSVAQYLKSFDAELVVTDFKRFTLRAE